jgi:hypothetical protein
MVEQFARKYTGLQFDIVDLNFDGLVDLPVPGKVLARNNPAGIYSIPKTIQR